MAAGQSSRPAVGDETHFGFRTVKTGDKQRLVDDVFRKVAGRYDLMNDLMSGGLHRLWKDAAVTLLNPPRNGTGFRVVDVAGGTGDIASRILAAAPGASVTVCDINGAMLREGERRAHDRGETIRFVQGSGEDLPFEDSTFDAYTIAFGIRNIPHIDRALAEAFRVLAPGGRFICLEFSAVDIPGLDALYDAYSFNAIPLLGELVAKDRDSYQYLVESIRKFPDQQRFAAMIRDAGFERVHYRNLSGGIAAIHAAWRL